ncbi:hypothetical protein [Natronorubrum texcoconense]|uniref:Uncharacterized protein n=1 Tax=Natronorubrum texcoconense TaxID=1095776 RepID=A0A1G8U5W6_9EURY|nr:hypothetical protein [Natronorubrum texcoconense]SDJ49168.1 hypothetical protein SAMN04515672_0752 [Natronorubrum texcoconense]
MSRSSGRGPRRDGRRGSSRDPDERGHAESNGFTSPSARLKAVFVLLVGLSGGTMALQGGASLAAVGLASIVGIVAGGALLWYMLWILE